VWVLPLANIYGPVVKYAKSLTITLASALILLSPAASAAPRINSVILYVADGLRAGSVDEMPASPFNALRTEGVAFPNSHSLFPTFTTANASALATGHYLGDTGDFSNTILAHTDIKPLSDKTSAVPYLESNAVLRLMNEKYAGDYLHEESLIEAADQAGYSVAVVGKVGPAAIQNLKGLTDGRAIIIDDQIGHKDGIALPLDLQSEINAVCDSNNKAASSQVESAAVDCLSAIEASVPNIDQQAQFIRLVTKVLLPRFVKASKPFLLVYWSRDPDKSQHGQKDDSLVGKPIGINGPTSKAAIENAGKNLQELRKTLNELGIEDTTNIIVTADHGFSTIDKSAHGSTSAGFDYDDIKQNNQLPPGFLAIDLAHYLKMKLFDPDQGLKEIVAGNHPVKTNGFIGADGNTPEVIVAGNGGSDLIYLTGSLHTQRATAAKLVQFLARQAYVGGLFVNDALGAYSTALPLSEIGLCGSALTPAPSIVVSFASTTKLCDGNPDAPRNPELCAYAVADSSLVQGQGMHGSFSRADTHNFTAAIGPDFKAGFEDPMPVSNADVAATIANLLHLDLKQKGQLRGRVLSEAFKGGFTKPFKKGLVRSPKGKKSDPSMILITQWVDTTRYFDAAGFPDRTAGLDQAVRIIKSPIRIAHRQQFCGISVE
jgi:hypothetical protein